ncbi:phosphoglucosamine mutase [Candidatus Poriferisodalis sp.]|uniref:phosphoglucosamine mutase n=1 Tax=Candidatus Poriferisodalis sp. TaxID=3101277 RepID=UPI003D0AFD0B
MNLGFGTDGIRGPAYSELDEVVVHALGRAAAETVSRTTGGARWVTGRDTRTSGPALAAALAAGLRAAGAEVIDLGVVPTPVVAFAAGLHNAAGAMVSASHNPWHDNGVKLFARGGTKLDDGAQASVAEHLARIGITHGDRPAQSDVARRDQQATTAGDSDAATNGVLASYEASLSNAIGGRSLDGLHLVVDCANGAAAPHAAPLLERLGAQVTALFCEPDGRNINEGCGSTHPAALQAAVLEAGADLGLAFDGDGDRLIAVDSVGELIDGDRAMALFAVDLRDRGLLADDILVVTVMSNLGLRRAMFDAGIGLTTTAVGDRAVLEALDAGGFSLGGEQSGHIVFRHEATTGDGLRTAVHLADLVVRRTAADPLVRSSADLAAPAMQTAPQVLRNVELTSGPRVLPAAVQRKIDDVGAQAGPDTRVLVRPSGTEPVIRVMVEAPTAAKAEALAERLVELVRAGIVETTG